MAVYQSIYWLSSIKIIFSYS